MKSLFLTILIIAAAFTAYDYFVAPPGEKLIFTEMNKGLPAEEPAPAVVKTEPVAPTAPVAAPTTAPAPVAAPVATTPAPMPAAPTAPAKPVAEANGFTPPSFDPIEKLTGNWLKIPATAFPRQVKLAKATLFKMSVGGSNMAAGSSVFALSASEGMLTLAPAETSTARAVAPIDDTDLKALLNAAYEGWKPLRVAQLRKAYERRLAAAKAPAVVAPTTVAGGPGVDGGGKPVRATDGTYPLLVASVRNNDVTEITLEAITFWGEAVAANVEGKPAWGVPVRFNANTVFGKIEAEAQAIVQNGRVKGWFYTGSGEEVP